MIDELAELLEDDDYEKLPEAIKRAVTRKQWLCSPEAVKRTIVRECCEPEAYTD